MPYNHIVHELFPPSNYYCPRIIIALEFNEFTRIVNQHLRVNS